MDEATFDMLYDRYHRSVLAYCRRRIAADDAWDVCADTFALAWQKRDEVPPMADALPWLYAVAYRLLRNRRRKMARRSSRSGTLVGAEPRPTVEGQVVRNVETEALIEALGKLPARDQELFRLVAWEGLTHAQAGAVVGRRESAVSVRLHRALPRLRAHLASMGFEGVTP